MWWLAIYLACAGFVFHSMLSAPLLDEQGRLLIVEPSGGRPKLRTSKSFFVSDLKSLFR